MHRSLYIALAVALVVVPTILTQAAHGQVLFSDSLDSSTGWGEVHGWLSEDGAEEFDNDVEFGYDYSALGIPEAPNSVGGGNPTSGLRLRTNLFEGVPNAVGVYPVGQSFSGQFMFQFDLWVNAPGPFPAGGTGSTEFGGGAIAFDSSLDQVGSGAVLLVSGEGGSSTDYRLYADDELQSFGTHLQPATITGDFNGNRSVDVADYTVWRDALGTTVETAGTGLDIDSSGVVDVGDYNLWKENFGSVQTNDLYNDALTDGNADLNPYLENIFPGKTAPLAQIDLFDENDAFPIDQSGTTKDGTIAFRWVTYKFTVDTVNGTALVQMVNNDNGLTADIATFTYENTYDTRETIETKLLTDFAGNISLAYRDPFSSIVADEYQELAFGLFDNVIVTDLSPPMAAMAVPEPGTAILLGVSAVALVLRRRSKFVG